MLKPQCSSNSHYAVLMITELFSFDERINLPGSSGGENWCFRLRWPPDEIRGVPQLKVQLRQIGDDHQHRAGGVSTPSSMLE